jgi:hypothetical protein
MSLSVDSASGIATVRQETGATLPFYPLGSRAFTSASGPSLK